MNQANPNPDVLVRVCSYCSKMLGTKPHGPEKGTALSHGICPKCVERLENGEVRIWAKDTAAPKQPPAQLYAALSKVLGEINRVPKNGRNDFHHYDYATEGDLLDTVRPQFAANGLALIPEILDRQVTPNVGKHQDKVRNCLKLGFLLVHSSGETAGPFIWYGEAEDSGDKGLYKAMTGALKYFVFKLCLVSTGDDPEQPNQADQAKKPTPEKKPPARSNTPAKRAPSRQPDRTTKAKPAGTHPIAKKIVNAASRARVSTSALKAFAKECDITNLHSEQDEQRLGVLLTTIEQIGKDKENAQ